MCHSFSLCSNNILLVICYVIFILHIHHFRTRKSQIRSGTVNKTFTLQLLQKNNRWKCTTLDPCQSIKHYCSSIRMPILKWISRTHMVYPDPNGDIIHHRKSSLKIILVLFGSSFRNDDQPSSRPLRPETHHTF